MSEMTIYNPTYYVDSVLWNSVLVSQIQAEEYALDFLRKNVKEDAFENITVSSYLVDSQPIWAVLIGGPNLRTQLRINALTGEVIGWNLSSSSSSNRETIQLNSTKDAEEIAFEFLKNSNYSIPLNARYIGANQFPSDIDGIYIEFRHYEGAIRVGRSRFDPDLNPDYAGEGIIVRVSQSIGLVTQFGYRWTSVGSIPTSGILSQDRAEYIALRNSSDSDTIIVGSSLALIEIESRNSIDGSPQLHLSWIVAGNVSNKLRWFLVDGFSGEFLDEQRTNGPVDISLEKAQSSIMPYIVIPVAIISSITVAVVVKYLSVKEDS
jgi:hypothetical protein